MIMKKYFIFAAIATVGLFASCSSSDDAISESPTVENQDGRWAIKVGVGTPAATIFRGTGTVGGVGTGANAWHGQKINVFMFKQGTLDLALEDQDDATSTLYENTSMYTPGTDENVIPGMSAPAASGEAMITTGDIKYYPINGNFDFFGYHGDDAVSTAPAKSADEHSYTVPFAINGTQDLMSTKAALTQVDEGLMGTSTDYYSAKAARKGVHPTLTFKHLLSRLSFVAIAGNDKAAGWVEGTNDVVSTITAAVYDAYDPTNDAAIIAQCVIKDYTPKTTGGTLTDTEYGALPTANQANWNATDDDAHEWEGADPLPKADFDLLTAEEQAKFDVANYTRTIPGTPAHQDATKAVKINSIKIKSKTTGTLVVAWDDQAGISTDADKIEFDANDNGTWLSLLERPTWIQDGDQTITSADIEAYKTVTYADLDETTDPKKSDVDAAIAAATVTISDAVYATLSDAGKAKYVAITNPEKELLTALTPVSPRIDGSKAANDPDRYPETTIGEALIVAPKSELVANSTTDEYEGYEMEVSLSQYVMDNWNPTPDGHYTTKSQKVTYTIAAPSNASIDYDGDGNPDGASAQKGFLQNVSYKVKLTVYGWERIVVTAVVEPWIEGEEIPVGQD